MVSKIYFLIMHMCLSTYVYVHVSTVPAESRKGLWIPWSWSCGLPDMTAGNQTLVLYRGLDHSQLLNHFSMMDIPQLFSGTKLCNLEENGDDHMK